MGYYSTAQRNNPATPAAHGGDIIAARPAEAHRHPMRAVQEVLGNHAVQRMANGNGRDGSGLVVHPSGDPFEREAERVAARVSDGAPEPVTMATEGPSVQRAPRGGGAIVPETADGAGSASGAGHPLDAATRAQMESHIGYDFANVRLHTDEHAAASADALDARAYTAGADIVFSRGAYQPHTREGRHLLAHELAHVAQQRRGISRQPAGSSAAAATAQTVSPGVVLLPTTQGVAAQQQLNSTCTTTPGAARQKILMDAAVARATLDAMEFAIGIAPIKSKSMKMTTGMVDTIDNAIQAELGAYIGKGKEFSKAYKSPSKNGADASVKSMSPTDYAKERVPDDAAALRVIGRAAMAEAPQVMADACITSANDPDLITTVATPILMAMEIDFVRDYYLATTGGNTVFSDHTDPAAKPHVIFPDEGRNIGTVIMHEAMHFYTSPQFRAGTSSRSDHSALMEGGAEYFARIVIMNQLSADPAFAINYSTYKNYVSYVQSMLGPRIASFPAMFFQGLTYLLPPPPP